MPFLVWDICLGGVFKLELFLPEEYPMAAPKVLNHDSFLKSSMTFLFICCWKLDCPSFDIELYLASSEKVTKAILIWF